MFSYLLGSFPSAIFIGKVFYGVDVRKEGSHNAGGTNVGRVIGKKAGLITIALDVFKTIVAVWVSFFVIAYTPLKDVVHPSVDIAWIYYAAGVGTAIGHSFPIFAHFKGGKAMSVYAGFVLGTNIVFAALGITFFLMIFFLKKYVSLASLTAPFFVCFLSIFTAIFKEVRLGYFGMDETYIYSVYLFLLATYVLIRHIPNLKRLLNHTEPHTHFKKTPKVAEGQSEAENSDQN